jgi:hypothetical protein
MLHKIGTIGSALLEGVLIITVLTLVPHAGIVIHTVSACPHCWVGNDDGEWDNAVRTITYDAIEESLDRAMTWNDYGCTSGMCNIVSLQYNPDFDYSNSLNRCPGGGWGGNDVCYYQSGADSDRNNNIQPWVEVWDVSTNPTRLYWNPPTPWQNVDGILTANSYWLVQQDFISSSNPRIKDTYYQFEHCYVPSCNSYSFWSYQVNVPGNLQQWLWVRSNVCWCGVNGPSTITFTSIDGMNYMSANGNLATVGPPNDIATLENSNVGWGCMNGGGTWTLSQGFSINNGHC